jgi:hypothetical protein
VVRKGQRPADGAASLGGPHLFKVKAEAVDAAHAGGVGKGGEVRTLTQLTPPFRMHTAQ